MGVPGSFFIIDPEWNQAKLSQTTSDSIRLVALHDEWRRKPRVLLCWDPAGRSTPRFSLAHWLFLHGVKFVHTLEIYSYISK
jgi:hypothetical protein